MKISVTPEDLVRRCLWDHYVYYIVGSDKEAEKILKENVEFEVSEREALVIGLLKVIETDNLIHKYNTYIDSNGKKDSYTKMMDRHKYDTESIYYYDGKTNIIISSSDLKKNGGNPS